jgi:hypothetical protein
MLSRVVVRITNEVILQKSLTSGSTSFQRLRRNVFQEAPEFGSTDPIWKKYNSSSKVMHPCTLQEYDLECVKGCPVCSGAPFGAEPMQCREVSIIESGAAPVRAGPEVILR